MPQQRKQYEVELTDGRKFVVESDTPPTEQDVLAALGNNRDAGPAPLPKSTPGDGPAGVVPRERRGEGAGTVLRMIKENPVTAGSLAGGAIAAPFTGGMSLLPAAATVGGASAIGAGAGQMASGERPSLTTMAKEGMFGATGQGVGRGVSAAAGWLAPKVAEGVLRMAPRLSREFGKDGILGAFLRERIPVGGSEQVAGRIATSSDAAQDMVRTAEQAGAAPVSPREIIREFRPVRDEVVRRAENASPTAASEMSEIGQRARDLHKAGSKPLTRNQELKSQAQRDADNAFRAQDRGAQIRDTTAKLDKAVAIGRQKASEARIPNRPDGTNPLREQNRNTRDLMGLEEALTDAEARNRGFVVGNPLHMVSSLMPGLTSRGAFVLDAIGESNLPAGLLRNALIALLSGERDPQKP